MAPKMERASVPAESVGVGYVPPHRFHEREDRASLSWLSPRPTLADLLSAGVGIVPPRPVAVFGICRDSLFFRRFLCEQAMATYLY